MVNYYELLGLDRNASVTQIKTAYRSLAKVMHPDAGGTSGTFQLLQEAYETLTDPVRRADYDSASPPPATPATRPGTRPQKRRNFGEDPNFVPKPPRIDLDTVSWWRWAPASGRVRYIPAAGYGHTPVLAAFGGWLVIASLGLVVVSSLVLFAVWLLVLVALGAVVFRLARRLLAARRANHAFVAEFGDHAVHGRPSTEPGNHAERLTAELLVTYLTRLPGARIFHGLALPGSVFSDVDHAVLCGRRLVLIDSKMWLPGHYTADKSGTLWRNGHRFRGGGIRLPEGVTAFGNLLPEVDVRGAHVLYPSRAGEITTGAAVTVAPPMSPDQFVREVGEWLAAEPDTVDRDVFRTVLTQVVS